MSEQKQCEGFRRHGGAFTMGPVKWEQCTEKATVLLTVKQAGDTKTFPACNTCWNEAIERRIVIEQSSPLPQ